tara:strand:- start:160 stop:1212 length:1053 start_codon:yes stop_codon:yes gene_type:complete
MNTQLNIPITDFQPIDPTLLIDSIENQLNLEMSQNMNRLMYKKVIFNRNGIDLQPINGWEGQVPDLKSKHFTQSSEHVTVVGIDSSCIHIAETDVGSVYASRASAVLSQHGRLSRCIRIGPIIYYFDEITASQLSNELTGTNRLAKLFLLDRSLTQQVIRERLEQSVAFELVRMMSHSIIMLDGCLRSSKFENIKNGLRTLLEFAEKKDNTIVGLSKTTQVGLLNRFSQVLYSSQNIPAYLDVNDFMSPFINHVEGHIILVRFSSDGHPFRVDISSFSDIKKSLSLLLSSDSFYHGYPETLRLAHHLSIFNATQSDSIKSYLVKNMGVVEIPSEDIRHSALGSMGFRLTH